MTSVAIPTVTAAMIARRVPELASDCSVLEAWQAVEGDDEGLALVCCGSRPLAVLDRAHLAERWPGGGPLTVSRTSLRSVLPPLLGVEALPAGDDLDRVARAVLASPLPALPVWSPEGAIAGLVSPRVALSAVLGRDAPRHPVGA